jgi:hypothetical protein
VAQIKSSQENNKLQTSLTGAIQKCKENCSNNEEISYSSRNTK